MGSWDGAVPLPEKIFFAFLSEQCRGLCIFIAKKLFVARNQTRLKI